MPGAYMPNRAYMPNKAYMKSAWRHLDGARGVSVWRTNEAPAMSTSSLGKNKTTCWVSILLDRPSPTHPKKEVHIYIYTYIYMCV